MINKKQCHETICHPAFFIVVLLRGLHERRNEI